MLARRVLSLLVVGCCFASSAGTLRADVKLPPFFSDHMVLQRDGRAPIWGTAAPGEAVTVKFRDQERKSVADDKGNWRVVLEKLKVGGPDELTIAGTNTLTLKDVLVGEVWVGSGQSNMAGNVGGYAKDDPTLAELAAKDYPRIRGCNARGGWTIAEAKNNPRYSAILFAFAVRLNKELDVPVGMMLGAVGGTPSGAWLSEAALAADEPSQKQMAKYVEEYPALLKNHEEVALPRWRAAAEKLKTEGKPVGREPPPPVKPGTALNQKPGYLFEQHLRPFVGYGIRGALWDQGESGTAVGGVDQYTLMGALIRGWRNEWSQGDFPFIYVQKPSGNGCAWDYENPVTNKGQPFSALPAAVPADGQYVETHVKIMTYPNTGMAISSDLGQYTHPTNKSGYGSRSAQVALGLAYGKPVEYYGPVYASHTIDGDKVTVKFTHVGQGLATRHGTKLQGFAVAGDDKKFHWADAVIDGETVVLSSPMVKEPKAVRYAWSNVRTWANLFNKDGLPAVTFRTDSW